jgi:hypothetical protein
MLICKFKQFRLPLGSEYWTGYEFRGFPKNIGDEQQEESEEHDQQQEHKLGERKSRNSARRAGWQGRNFSL